MPEQLSPEEQLRERAAARPQRQNEAPLCSEGTKALCACGGVAVLVFALVWLFDGKPDRRSSEPVYRTYSAPTSNPANDYASQLRQFEHLGNKRYPTQQEIRELLILDGRLGVQEGQWSASEFEQWTGEKY